VKQSEAQSEVQSEVQTDKRYDKRSEKQPQGQSSQQQSQKQPQKKSHKQSELIDCTLSLPAEAAGLVIVVPGTEATTGSVQDLLLSKLLAEVGMGTLLLNRILEPSDHSSRPNQNWYEDKNTSYHLIGMLDWLAAQPFLREIPIGLLGSKEGAIAAMEAAAARPQHVRAVVSQGGRVDLAFDSLASTVSPVLMVVGDLDVDLCELNAWAASHLLAPHATQVIHGAGAEFVEPSALAEAASLARDWFMRYLPPVAADE
jgi:putative phosphoribosyl transferase